MKAISRNLAVLVICAMLVGFVSPAQQLRAEGFSPRTSAPEYDNPYYYSNLNVYYANGWGMPNCTAYAYGRVYEILGHQPDLSRWNAGEWWFDNIRYGWYAYGSEPRVGAVACWDNWDQSTGHVAVVEEVYSDGTCLVSESAWGGTNFRTRVMKWDSSDRYMGNYRFLGYIYSGSSVSASQTVENARATVKYGSRGKAVSELQQYLYELGYLNAAPDGTFGSMTDSAVRVFQRANSLAEDGIIGSLSWAVLDSGSAIPAASAGIGAPDTVETKTSGTVPVTLKTADNRKVNYTTVNGESKAVLHRGDEGSDVRTLQELLTALGYNTGGIDGAFGSKTFSAVTSFQSRCGLEADGVVGRDTWNALINGEPVYSEKSVTKIDPSSMPTLSVGAHSDAVVTLQKLLNELNFNCGSADGYFGNQTRYAVVNFQTSKGLEADGIVGKQTWKALAE